MGNSVDVYTTDAAKDIFDPLVVANNGFVYEFAPSSLNLPILGRLKSDFIDTFCLLKNVHKKIARDIDAKGYDIVLVNIDTHTQAPFILRYLKTKSVYYCLEPLRNAYEYSLRIQDGISFLNRFYENLNRWIRKNIDRKNARSCSQILALSLFGRERIIGAYDLYAKVLGLGANESFFKPQLSKKKNQVLFIAAKDSLFGYDLAKEAVNLIPKNIRPELKVVSWKKDNSERMTDEEVVELYNQSIATLSLSKFDTSGLVPLESMACAVPVIALNVGGYREIVVNGQNGFLVEFDAKEIADRLKFLIKNSDKAKDMGRKGRKMIEENWTWGRQIRELNTILAQTVENL
jgi:glycosyltransferase involved in cell wall biosynthesis